MSIPISGIEATAVARFLSDTYSHIGGQRLPHLSCLHLLARAYGYRNWNAMKPAVENLPDMAKLNYGFGTEEYGSRLFAIARVALRGEEPAFFVVSHETSEPTMQVLASELASLVAGKAGFRGVRFHYTRPDPSPAPSAGDGCSAATTPVVATTTDSGATITLWWISVGSGKPYYNHPAPVVRVRNTRFENWAAYGTRTPTDCFLETLTGVARPIRRCLYVPVESSPPWGHHPEAYHPLVVLEGKADGEVADWHCGLDRMQAVRRAYLENRRAGLSNLDIGDIVDRYRSIEPNPDAEPEPDFYWLSESND